MSCEKRETRIAIIEFPGTNCERESAAAIWRAGMQPVHFRWNRDPAELASFDGYLIAGGFSYEDRSRSGIIAALDPLIPCLKAETERGKPLIGICNGAQILVETGMVPGLENYRPGAALAANRRIRNGELIGTGFYNAWVSVAMETAPKNCAFTSSLKAGEPLRIPAAHAEGRFIIPEALLQLMKQNRQILFRYTDDRGDCVDEFPVNPNGSVYNIAGICNAAGNVLALMPHPERCEAGDPIFTSMHAYIKTLATGGYRQEERSLPGISFHDPIAGNGNKEYTLPSDARAITVELIITDNEAVSVEKALRQRGIPISVTRQTHWEIAFSPDTPDEQVSTLLAEILASGELYNANKEYTVSGEFKETTHLTRTILIRDRDGEDSVGEHKRHALQKWFGIESVANVRRGILWILAPETDDPEEGRRLCDEAEETHIFTSQFANRRFTYAGNV